MAQQTVTHACGHGQTHNLLGPHKDRERKKTWLGTTVCTECYRAEIEAARKASFEAATEASKETGLPDLTGSEKQVEWATRIRQHWINGATQFEDDYARERFMITLLQGRGTNPEALKIYHEGQQWINYLRGDSHVIDASQILDVLRPAIYEWAGKQTSAHWWIDNQVCLNAHAVDALQLPVWAAFKASITGGDPGQAAAATELQVAAKLQVAAEERAEDARLAETAKAEATMYAENPISPLIAEITLYQSYVAVSLPDKNPQFREVMKSLKYKWFSPWERTVKSPRNFAVETAYRLLKAGFNVRLHDPELRKRVIEGDFKAIDRAKIGVFVTGENAGRFAITWPKEVDFYAEAKSLHGARYAKPGVAVPAESFEEVLDFAAAHCFEVTHSARKLADAQSEILENAIRVPLADVEHSHAALAPMMLPGPANAAVPAHLLDEQ